MAAPLDIIRKSLGSSIKPPSPSDRVALECCYSHDTPFSPEGIYLNLHAFTAASPEYVALDRARTGASVYLHLQYARVAAVRQDMAEEAPAAGAAPTRLAIGGAGGFAADAPPPFTVAKRHALVVFTGPAPALAAAVGTPGLAAAGPAHRTPDYPSPATSAALPEYLATVVAAVLAHEERSASTAAASSAWAEEPPKVSRYAAALVPRADAATGVPRAVSPSASDWVCDAPGCGKREGLWLNLTDGYIGCGRRQYGGAGGNEHALEHFRAGGTGPLCVKLGTINAAGGECYSYAPDEDDAVENPHLARHLAFFRINIMALEKTEKTTLEQSLDFNLAHDWSKLTESGSTLVSVSGPGRLGLENLGNTCYMSSVLQLLAAVPEWTAQYTAPGAAPALYAGAGGGAEPRGGSGNGGVRDDLPSQTARLLLGLLAAPQYAAPAGVLAARMAKAAAAAAAAPSSGAAPPAAAEAAQEVEAAPGGPTGYLVPTLHRRLVGKGHADFSSSRQQDAPDFMEWLFALHKRAGVAAGAAGRALPSPPSAFFEFTTQQRLSCTQSGGVRYKHSPPETILRLNIPESEATNAEEVARISALREAAVRGPTDPEAKRARLAEITTSHPSIPLDDSGLPAPPKPHVPFAACLGAWGAPSVMEDYLSPATGQRGVALTANTLTSLPPYLCIVLNRYKMNADWTTKKIDASIPMPEELDLGSALGGGVQVLAPGGVGGLQPGEVPLPEGAAASSASAPASAASAPPPPPAMDEELVATLLSMDFPLGACRRAAQHCAARTPAGGAEEAMEWIMSHMEDADFAADFVEAGPVGAAAGGAAGGSGSSGSGGAGAGAGAGAASSSSGAPDAGSVASLCDMGFSEAKAKAALKACGGSVERAMDWLFSHGDEEMVEEAAGAGAGEGAASAAAAAAAAAAAPAAALALPALPANARYTLVGIVSHMGASLASGHYVAHIRKDEQGRPAGMPGCASPQWLLFNDAKVALSQAPPLDAGFMYLYRRLA